MEKVSEITMMSGYTAGFTTLKDEIRLERLPVQGTIPSWLRGTLVRNGPGQFDLKAGSYRHWFDGLGMLHAFRFDGNQVGYTGRYLRTPAYTHDNASGKIHYRGFATDPCRSLFSRVFSIFNPPEEGMNTNVNVNQLVDRTIAMTETPMAIKFDPHTLETLGIFGYQDDLSGQVTTAHPHFDFQRNVGFNYLLKFGAAHAYQIYTLAGAQRALLARIPVKSPAYMHSFGMTARYVILAEFPFKLPSVFPFLLGDKPFIENYHWIADQPTRFLIVDKDSGEVAATVETEAFFAFHHINAYERGDEIALDVAAYPDASIINEFYLDRLRRGEGYDDASQFRRYRIPLKGGRATYEVVSTEGFELPRIHYRRANSQPYRYAYGAATRRGTRDFVNQLVKVDAETGETKTWYAPDCYPGEPVFVPAPGERAEDEGVALSVVLDGAKGASFLLILDACCFEEIARAEVPHAIPFGFHGQFF